MPAIRAFRGFGALSTLLPVLLAARGSEGTAFVGAETLKMPGRLLCKGARVRTCATPPPLTALAV